MKQNNMNQENERNLKSEGPRELAIDELIILIKS